MIWMLGTLGILLHKWQSIFRYEARHDFFAHDEFAVLNESYLIDCELLENDLIWLVDVSCHLYYDDCCLQLDALLVVITLCFVESLVETIQFISTILIYMYTHLRYEAKFLVVYH